MQLGAVCDRTINGEVIEFGTSGYTMNNVFVLYDRNTDSVWYPLSDDTFDAVAGPSKGTTLEFIAKPEVMRLHEWAAKHPKTLVLIPPPMSEAQKRQMQRRAHTIASLSGSWEMATDFNGQSIDAVMTLTFDEEKGFTGIWESQGQEMEMTDIRFRGGTLRFKREIPGGSTLQFEGTLEGTRLKGQWTGDMGEIECSGTKVEERAPASQPDR